MFGLFNLFRGMGMYLIKRFKKEYWRVVKKRLCGEIRESLS